MVYHDSIKERTPAQIQKYLSAIKRKKTFRITYLALSSAAVMFMLNNFIRNDSEASDVERLIKNREVDSTYNSLGMDLSSKRDNLFLELISDRNYLQRYLELSAQYSKPNLENISKHAMLKQTAVALDDAGAQNIRDILMAGALPDSVSGEWTPRAINFKYLTHAIDDVIGDFARKESEIFTLSTRAQITRVFKDKGSADPIGDMRELTRYRRDFLLSLLPVAMFGEDALNSFINMAIWQAETKSDETATGRLNFLDTGKGQIQPATALNLISRMMTRPEFEYMLRPLQLIDSTGYVSWDDFGKKIKDNLETIRSLNVENLKITDIEQLLGNYERIYAGKPPQGILIKKSFLESSVSPWGIFSSQEYQSLQSMLIKKEDMLGEIERIEYAIKSQGDKDDDETSRLGKDLISKRHTLATLQAGIGRILNTEKRQMLEHDMRTLRSERDAIVDRIAANESMTDISKYYDVLFDNKLQTILTGFYISQDIFGREEYWRCVYNYHKNASVSVEQAMLEFLYVGYMAGPGSFNAAYTALRDAGFSKSAIHHNPAKRFGFRFVFENTYRLYKEYAKIKEYSDLGLFGLKPRNGDESVNTIKNQVGAMHHMDLEHIANSYFKKFNMTR